MDKKFVSVEPYESPVQTWMEEHHKGFMRTGFRAIDRLYSKKSDFQTVDVIETPGHGKMLFNDGLTMISERDEFVYHDMITHVPLFVHPNPKKVLVIGGGDGGTAREVLRHEGVEKCVMVEIDGAVVEACKLHIPQTACVFENPRLELLIQDGVEFVQNTSEKFDVVIVDSTDPIGPAAPLFSTEFYGNVKRVLTENGIVVSQGESPFYNVHEQNSLNAILKTQFSKVHFYNFTNLTYPGGLWSFSFASNAMDPLKDFNESRVQDSGLEFGYYNAALHRASFCLPTFQIKNLSS